MRFSLRVLLIFTAVEAALFAVFRSTAIALQPMFLFAICIAKGTSYWRSHGTQAAFGPAIRFLITGFGCILIFGFLIMGAGLLAAMCECALAGDWHAAFFDPFRPRPGTGAANDSILAACGSAVLVIATLVAICISSAYFMSSRMWAVAGYLACPGVWLGIIWPRSIAGVYSTGFDAGRGFEMGILYVVASAFWLGGILAARRRNRAEVIASEGLTSNATNSVGNNDTCPS